MADFKATLDLLNLLGPLYHGLWGLSYEGMYDEVTDIPYGCAYLTEEAVDTHNATIKNIKGLHEENTVITYKRKYLESLAQTAVPFNNVILKFTTYWKCLPSTKWYNQIQKNDTHDPQITCLRPLYTRRYITIEEPWMVISLDQSVKKKPLTVEDILFACRALMGDGYRSIDDGFHLLECSEDTLTLEPYIDNFST